MEFIVHSKYNKVLANLYLTITKKSGFSKKTGCDITSDPEKYNIIIKIMEQLGRLPTSLNITKSQDSSSFLSPTVRLVLPCCNLAVFPELTRAGIWDKAANPNNHPMAWKMDLSITKGGGTIALPTIRNMVIPKQIQKLIQ